MGSPQSPQYTPEASCRLLQATFPDSANLPALFPELPVNPSVALLVACHLVAPELCVLPWLLVTARATMPKAAIHEDGYLLSWKCKVWLARQGLVPAPAGYLVFLEEREKLELRGLVALPSDGLHDLTADLVECHAVDLSL